MIEETIKVTGDVQIKLVGPDGKIKQEQTIKNLVVTTGKEYIASRMTGTTTAMSHMGVGSGTTAAAAGDTALGNQLGRVALTSGTSTDAVTT